MLAERLVRFHRSFFPGGEMEVLREVDQDAGRTEPTLAPPARRRRVTPGAAERPSSAEPKAKRRKEAAGKADPPADNMPNAPEETSSDERDGEAACAQPRVEPPSAMAAADARIGGTGARRRAGADATARLQKSLDKVVGRGEAAHEGEQAARKTKMQEIREELAAFLNSPVSQQDVTSEAFWGEPEPGVGDGTRSYPNLWRGARHFPCLSASNGDAERLFSAAQQLLEQSRRRARMAAATVQELFLLKASGPGFNLCDYVAHPSANAAGSGAAAADGGSGERNEEEEISDGEEEEVEVRC